MGGRSVQFGSLCSSESEQFATAGLQLCHWYIPSKAGTVLTLNVTPTMGGPTIVGRLAPEAIPAASATAPNTAAAHKAPTLRLRPLPKICPLPLLGPLAVLPIQADIEGENTPVADL
jgi:hypothetical protein